MEMLMEILPSWLILLLWALLVFVLLPAIALGSLWGLIAFIFFLATPKSDEAKHKKAENMLIKTSAVLTVGVVLAAVCYLLLLLRFGL